jgi:protein-disulfide isomerase
VRPGGGSGRRVLRHDFLRELGVGPRPYDRASPAPTVRPGARCPGARTAERSQRRACSFSGAAARRCRVYRRGSTVGTAAAVASPLVGTGGPAPHTLDLYEDPLCPACQAFEQRAGDAIAQGVAAGRLQVRHHLVNLLEQRSDPPGYSTAAGNAMLGAAEHGAFPTVHSSLYAAQPAEGGAAYDTAQLVDLGRRAGAGPGYAECVQSGRYDAQTAQNDQQAVTDPALQQDGSFGTPTIVLDGRRLEPGAPDLDAVLAG